MMPGNRKRIFFKDLNANLKPETPYELNEHDDQAVYKFSAIHPSLAHNPKLFLFRSNQLEIADYPSNNSTTIIKSYTSDGMFLDVKLEGGKDVLYFCTLSGYYKYNYDTGAEDRFMTFPEHGGTSWEDVTACLYLRGPNRIVHIERDRTTVWEKAGSNWQIKVWKRRFWFKRILRTQEIVGTTHFVLHARHAWFVIDSTDLSAVNTWEKEWDWADLNEMNYVSMTGFGFAKFDHTVPSVGAYKAVPDLFRIRSFDDNANTPVLIVKDNGPIIKYIYSTDAQITVISDSSRYFYDATYTTSTSKVVAVSGAANSANEYNASTHPKIHFIDTTAGSSSSWTWNTGDGYSKAVMFFTDTLEYIAFGDRRYLYVRKYDESNLGKTGSTGGVWQRGDTGANVWITHITKLTNYAMFYVWDREKVHFVGWDQATFTITDLNHGSQNRISSLHPAIMNDNAIFFSTNGIESHHKSNWSCFPKRVNFDKKIDNSGFCKLISGTEFGCTNSEHWTFKFDIVDCVHNTNNSMTKAKMSDYANCTTNNWSQAGCVTCAVNTYRFDFWCYPTVCTLSDTYFEECYKSRCKTTCPNARTAFQSCHCQTAPNIF